VACMRGRIHPNVESRCLVIVIARNFAILSKIYYRSNKRMRGFSLAIESVNRVGT